MATPMTTLTMLAPAARPTAVAACSDRAAAASRAAEAGAAPGSRGASAWSRPPGSSRSLADQLQQQVAVPDGEVRMIGGRGDLAEPGEQRGAPQAGRTAQAGQRALHQAANELAVPALAGQRVTDPGAPAVGAQARVASAPGGPGRVCRSR